MAFENEPRTRMNATLLGIGERDVPSDTLITTNPFDHAPRHVILDDGTMYDRCDNGSIADLLVWQTAETCDLNEQIVSLKNERDRLRELLRDTFINTEEYCDKHGIEYEGGADAWSKANADIDRRLCELGIEVDA